jgi:hypothetical protein
MGNEERWADYKIQGHAESATKSKSFYDGSNRLSFFVVAEKAAKNGDPCVVTKYTYIGATARVDASIEYIHQWNSAWDVSEDAPA